MNGSAYYFSAANATQILAARERGASCVELSLDLNRSRSSVPLVGDDLILDTQNRLSCKELQQIAGKTQRIFVLEGGRLELLEGRSDGYYKLVPTDQAPLLEISGVKMHISKGIDPFTSAGLMAAQAVKKNARVLDTCGGLGYAAIAALRLGARAVVSVEKSVEVLALRQRNPWSQQLCDPRIALVQADIATYIRELAPASFDAIIHDPPRFSLAGELYGEDFYRQLQRVLTRHGALFHYTGNPQLLKRGSRFMDRAVQRLKTAGFRTVTKVPALMGVTARS